MTATNPMTPTPDKPSGEALKACPFCGGAARRSMDCNSMVIGYAVGCSDCILMTEWTTETKAIAAWNARTPPPSALDDEVVALVDTLLPIFAKLYNGMNGPGHGHLLPGVWDDDISNGAKGGEPCVWCAHWIRAHALLIRFKDSSK